MWVILRDILLLYILILYTHFYIFVFIFFCVLRVLNFQVVLLLDKAGLSSFRMY